MRLLKAISQQRPPRLEAGQPSGRQANAFLTQHPRNHVAQLGPCTHQLAAGHQQTAQGPRVPIRHVHRRGEGVDPQQFAQDLRIDLVRLATALRNGFDLVGIHHRHLCTHSHQGLVDPSRLIPRFNGHRQPALLDERLQTTLERFLLRVHRPGRQLPALLISDVDITGHTRQIDATIIHEPTSLSLPVFGYPQNVANILTTRPRLAHFIASPLRWVRPMRTSP